MTGVDLPGQIEQIQAEIEELRRQDEAVRAQISEYMARKSLPLAEINELRYERYIRVHYRNAFLTEISHCLGTFNTTIADHLEKWKTLINLLAEGNEGKTLDWLNLEAHIKTCEQQLEQLQYDSQYFVNRRRDVVTVTDGSNRNAMLLAWRMLVCETEGRTDSNEEVHKTILAVQHRINELNEIEPHKATERAVTAQTISPLIEAKQREIEDLQAASSRQVPRPARVQQFDRNALFEDSPPRLQQAEQQLEDARLLNRKLGEYLKQLEDSLIDETVKRDRAHIDLMKAELTLQQRQIVDPVEEDRLETLIKHAVEHEKLDEEQKSIGRVFDLFFEGIVGDTIERRIATLGGYSGEP
jgi:hypothetical protein